ncbi:hypothetical protein [Ferrovibrio xuzhouensis]|uniref:Uncharacterized protein n=1 Tax=Ferrovibrio xuzhouensis TaxID=1576914 RepID=A0ABV7VB17_9PROT
MGITTADDPPQAVKIAVESIENSTAGRGHRHRDFAFDIDLPHFHPDLAGKAIGAGHHGLQRRRVEPVETLFMLEGGKVILRHLFRRLAVGGFGAERHLRAAEAPLRQADGAGQQQDGADHRAGRPCPQRTARAQQADKAAHGQPPASISRHQRSMAGA